MSRTRRWLAAGLGIVVVSATALALTARADSKVTGGIADLSNADPAVRQAEIDRLAAEPHSSVVAYAMAIREEPDLLVKSGYRAAIEKMGLSTDDVSNVDFLLAAPDAATRLQGVYLFSKQRPDLVATTLLAMAKNATEVEVARAAAAAAMGGAGASHRDDVAKLASDAGLPASVRAAAMRGLARIDAIGGGKVADIAADTGRSLADRRAAITALAAAGPGTSPNLRGLAGSSEAWIVAAAIDGLATVGSTEVETLDRLTQSLTAQDATERLAGMGALVRLSKAKEKRLVILPLVSDPDPRVAARAANTVGAVFTDLPKDAVVVLKGCLTSPDFIVRYEGALALNALGNKEGAKTMLTDQSSPNPSQAAMAKAAWKKITGR